MTNRIWQLRTLLICLTGLMQLSCTTSNAAAPVSPPISRTGISVNSVSLKEQTVALTLNEAVSLGLRDNHSIRSAYLQRVAQKFDLRVAEDNFSPKLTIKGSHLAYRNQDDQYRQTNLSPTVTLQGEYGTQFSLSWAKQFTQTNNSGQSDHDGASFTVIQPLLRGAGREVATAPVRLAQTTEQANRLTLKATVSDTITNIITAYRELLRAQEQVRIARDALRRSQQLLTANREMILAGRMAEFEVVQTEADVATQELAVEEARNQLDASRLELLKLLALDLNTPIKAVDSLNATQVDIGLARAKAIAKEQQPAYLKQVLATEQAAINLTIAHDETLWDVSLIAGASQNRSYQTGSAIDTSSRNWKTYAGVQIEIPLGSLNQRQSEVHAQVEVDTQEILLADARQSLERDVENAVRNLGTRWRQYIIAQRARDLSRRKLEIEREKLQAGRSSNFQVLSFEADLRSAESARLNALIAYLNAQADLDQTLGTTLESWDIDLKD
ncbi:outer membrane protein TolC [Marinobacterium sp. MBR-111]|jgi:outer membrane protein TolC|uniref:TolC family protein n=1 Tax=Marinobacterium sp. MBR-111 TaxID=3156463 RepID=UPI0033942257